MRSSAASFLAKESIRFAQKNPPKKKITRRAVLRVVFMPRIPWITATILCLERRMDIRKKKHDFGAQVLSVPVKILVIWLLERT